MKHTANYFDTGMSVRIHRLSAQLISRPAFAAPGEVVAWFGAMQAQDYAAARWAVGLRLSDGAATDTSIERAISDGSILRVHAMRWTWHLVAPQDVGWMVALVGPRLIARYATRHRQLGLDAETLRRSRAVMEKTLRDGGHLTRAEIAAVLGRGGVSAEGPRLSHLLARMEIDALICSGIMRGKQSTYALLDDRAPNPRVFLTREESLAELVRRYFQSRGPATISDFAWWSGLTMADARIGLECVKSMLVSDVADGRTYWRVAEAPATICSPVAHIIPAFDEYLVAYRDRDAALDPARSKRYHDGGGMLKPCVLVDGRVVGTWRRSLVRSSVALEMDMFDEATPREKRVITAAARRYGDFLGLNDNLIFKESDGHP